MGIADGNPPRPLLSFLTVTIVSVRATWHLSDFIDRLRGSFVNSLSDSALNLHQNILQIHLCVFNFGFFFFQKDSMVANPIKFQSAINLYCRCNSTLFPGAELLEHLLFNTALWGFLLIMKSRVIWFVPLIIPYEWENTGISCSSIKLLNITGIWVICLLIVWKSRKFHLHFNVFCWSLVTY